MSRFRVNTGAMRSQAGVLKDQGGEIEQLAQSLETIYHHLNIGSSDSTRAVERKLVKLEGKLIEQAVKADSLGKALEYIAQQFERSEQAVREFTDGTVSAATIVHEIQVLYTKILRALGLDKGYYNRKAGDPAYQISKKQEKMMDHYLSDACAALRKEERFSEETWYKATPKEREQILRDYLVEVNKIMGTERPTLIIEKMEKESLMGSYNGDTNTIRINSPRLSDADSYRLMKTIVHESRHGYQHQACEHPEKFMVSKETLDQWRENFKPGNYKTAKSDGWDAYARQPVEWDAMNFAKQDYYTSQISGPDYAGSW